MIELITGKPGSGKTYMAVQRLMELPLGKYVIWHNIAGLRSEAFPEPSLVKMIPDDVKAWCAKENQIEYAEACKEKYGRPMLVVIDEAQMVFGEKDAGLKGWLSWHRHLGQDIWLIAQHSKMIHTDYVVLAEYEIRAVRSMVLNMLVYQYRIGGETFKTLRRRRDKRVFAAYRSFDQGEVSKPAFKLVYWAVALLLMAVGGFGVLQYGYFGKGAEASQVPVVERVRKGRAVDVVKEVPKPVDVWEELSFAGVVGSKVLVQEKSGVLVDLGDVVRKKYMVVNAGARWVDVMTEEGRKTIRKRPVLLDNLGDSERGGTVPGSDSQRQRRKKDGSVGGDGNNGIGSLGKRAK